MQLTSQQSTYQVKASPRSGTLTPPCSAGLVSWCQKGVTVTHSVVAIYAPVFDAEKEEAKNSCYDDLQDAIDSAHSGNMLIVVGYWNAGAGPVDMTTR